MNTDTNDSMKTQKVILSILIFFTLITLPLSLFSKNKDEVKSTGHIASWDTLIKEKQEVIKEKIAELENQQKIFSQWYKSSFNQCGPAYKTDE